MLEIGLLPEEVIFHLLEFKTNKEQNFNCKKFFVENLSVLNTEDYIKKLNRNMNSKISFNLIN